MEITITEALAELKTIAKRLTKRRNALLEVLVIDTRMKDPFAADGGLVEHARRELQAIDDLQSRYIDIRAKIQDSNLLNKITIGDHTSTVAEWLTWRREIATDQKRFWEQAQSTLTQYAGSRVKMKNQATGLTEDVKVEYAFGLDDARSKVDECEEALGSLDGKLSLHNATTTIEID